MPLYTPNITAPYLAPFVSQPQPKPETNRVLHREKITKSDELTNRVVREGLSLSRNLDSLYSQAAKITPDYKSQADREMLFRRYRPIKYPEPLIAINDLAVDYIDRAFNGPWNPMRAYTKNIKPEVPFLDKEGDYEAPEEAWRMALGLPVRNKYIVPSPHRPLNETNKNSRYYTLNRDIVDPEEIKKRVVELNLKPGQSIVEPSFAPFIKESYMNRDKFSQVDPLQQFKLGVNQKGKPYIYDKYDFNFEPLSKVTRPYEYEFYQEFRNGGDNKLPTIKRTRQDASYYNPVDESIAFNPDNNPTVPAAILGHELFHHFQKLQGDLQRPEQYPGPLKTPDTVMKNWEGYYNRRDLDEQDMYNQIIGANPDFQFIPRDLMYNGYTTTSGTRVGTNDLMYGTPGTVEGDARQFEQDLGALYEGSPYYNQSSVDALERLGLTPEMIAAMSQQFQNGGIPTRYKNMGFTRVGQKKAGDGKHKWKVLAKKGDKYKVVQGGWRGMQDYTQHRSEKRRKRFWDRMGGKNSAKANNPFSPLYWHRKFGTW